MTWINSITGRRVQLLAPSLDSICINDIAHALSRINRYTGHIRTEHYSVAEHSVRCALAAAHMDLPPLTQMYALLHDAHEAYIGDVATPIKQALSKGHHAEDCNAESVEEISMALDVAIRRSVGLASPSAKDERDVKLLDEWLLRWEAPQLLRVNPSWHMPPLCVPELVDFRQPAIGWRPNRAKNYFLRRYRLLRGQLKGKQSYRAAA